MIAPPNPMSIASVLRIIGAVIVIGAACFAVLPVNAGKMPAYHIACMSNLKQIGLASLMYANDYDDLLPGRDAWMDQLYPYTKNRGLFHCVALKDEGGVGYAFNARLSGKSTAKLKYPEVTPLVFDSTSLFPNASDPFLSLPNPGRHNGRNNTSFADGHVKSLGPDQWVVLSAWPTHG